MHRIQRVTVACDFPFIAGARRRLLAHELPQARVRCADSLDLIGGFCTLDLCNLNQLFHIGRFLSQVQRLLSLLLMDLGEVPYDLIIPGLVFQKAIIKSPQFTHPTFILINYIMFDENNQASAFVTAEPAVPTFCG